MKNRSTGFIILGLLAVLLLGPLPLSCTRDSDQKAADVDPVPVATPRRTLEDISDDYMAARNRQDVDETLSYFDEYCQISPPHGDIIAGKDAIRKIMEWDAALGSVLTVDGMEGLGNTITLGSIMEHNAFFDLLGINAAGYEPGSELIFRDGLIIEVIPSGFTAESIAQMRLKMPPLLQWISAQYPEALPRLMTAEGDFNYSGENGKEWLTLLQEWKVAQNASTEPEAVTE